MKIKLSIFLLILILSATGITWLYQKTRQADINYYQAYRYFEKGRYSKAIPHYQRALDIEPSHTKALIELAYSCLWTGDNKQALEYFEKAEKIYTDISKTDTSPRIKRELAQLYLWNKQYQKAEQILENILKDNPLDPEAKLLLAKTYQYSGRGEKAATLYEELLEQGHKNK